MASKDPTAQLSRTDVEGHIHKLIDSLVNIKDETGEFLLKLDDGRVIDTKGWNDWEWTHGVGLYGLLKLHEITGDKSALEISLKWFADRLPVGTSKNVNTMAPFLTAAYLHEQGYAKYGAYLDAWAEWVMYTMPRTEEGGLQHMTYLDEHFGQLWDDTLMMSVMPLAKIGLVLNRPQYVEDAKRQFMVHTKYLADRETGLWFHGWTFDGRHNFAKARWARGNCWVTISIPDFIELLDLPPGDGLREFLVSTLKAQIDALVKYQDPATGLWHTLIDDPGSYVESSASAGFAYGILKAVRMRLLPPDPAYISAAKKAIAAVVKCISPKGELEQCSFGTPVFKDLDGYRQIPITSMPYGQALALLALTEQLRTYL